MLVPSKLVLQFITDDAWVLIGGGINSAPLFHDEVNLYNWKTQDSCPFPSLPFLRAAFFLTAK